MLRTVVYIANVLHGFKAEPHTDSIQLFNMKIQNFYKLQRLLDLKTLTTLTSGPFTIHVHLSWFLLLGEAKNSLKWHENGLIILTVPDG